MIHWFKAAWPLALSALAMWGIVRVLLQMYSDFELSRHGKPVLAWYTDLNQNNDVFRYAYAVDGVTYGGQVSWSDADSNIYSHKPGDELVGVDYCSTKPWLSNYRRNAELELRYAMIWTALKAAFFIFGVCLYWFRLSKRSHLDV
jgi:hypothetical protein